MIQAFQEIPESDLTAAFPEIETFKSCLSIKSSKGFSDITQNCLYD